MNRYRWTITAAPLTGGARGPGREAENLTPPPHTIRAELAFPPARLWTGFCSLDTQTLVFTINCQNLFRPDPTRKLAASCRQSNLNKP
jgi:hypothetical protein